MKYVVTKQEPQPDPTAAGKEEIFLFPDHLEFDVIIPLLGAIKNQNYGNWHRVRRPPICIGSLINNVFTSLANGDKTYIDSTDLAEHLFKKQISHGFKYIAVKAIMYYPSKPLVKVDTDGVPTESEVEEIYLFPKEVHHDCFYEIINNQDEYRERVSAGFVDSGLRCYGSSETMNVKSRKEDTELLKKLMS